MLLINIVKRSTRDIVGLICICVGLVHCPPTQTETRQAAPLPPRTLPTFGRNPNAGVIAQSSPFDLAIARGDQALRHGDYAEATRQFRMALELNGRDARPHFYLGEVAARQEQWANAEPELRAALAIDPRMAEAHTELGNVLRAQNRIPDAMQSYQQAIAIDPNLAEAHLNLGMAQEDSGDITRATGSYRTALRLAPTDPVAALNLGVLLSTGNPAANSPSRMEAFRALQSAVTNAGDDASVLVNAAPALRQLGEFALAVQALERALVLQPNSPRILGELAQALFARGDRPAALGRIAEAVRLAPERADLRYLQGLLFVQNGNRAEATQAFREAQRLGANTPIAQRAAAALTNLATPPRR